ncbi:hypothetical protein L9F63_000368, partial [Diploptera punctata]
IAINGFDFASSASFLPCLSVFAMCSACNVSFLSLSLAFSMFSSILDRSCCGRSVRNKVSSRMKVSVSIMTSVLSIVFFVIVVPPRRLLPFSMKIRVLCVFQGEFSYVAFDDKTLDEDTKKTTNTKNGDLYPNCDTSIWLRSCSQEILDPLQGNVTGCIPKWLKGTLLRNGPGSLKVGNMNFQHLFDGSALLHRFAIKEGAVTYQSRFIRTQTYKRNMAAQRIVVTEFGTKAAPDPCQTIFQRVSAMFSFNESFSDNAMISIYPFGDEYYAFTESPIIHRIDPKNLETMDRVNVSNVVGIVNHTSHPHVMNDGTVYNLGMSVGATGPHYTIVKFPPASQDESMFEQASVVGSVPARWMLHPSYMHTFGCTENYFIIVEQPLSVSVPAMIRSQIFNEPMAANLKWYDEKTQFHLIEKKNGKLYKTFQTEAFFYLHIINSYEMDNHLIIDICCYKDASMLDCMYVDALKEIQTNPDYAKMFRGRPLRFVMPLMDISPETDSEVNLVKLQGSEATAYKLSDGQIFCQPELLCDLGCVFPGRKIYLDGGSRCMYQYNVHNMPSAVEGETSGGLIKVDVKTRERKTWSEENLYPSEPIFVPSPDSKAEDDGVILSALIWGRDQDKQVGVLVLDASTWQELGRATFNTPSQVPKCLHGWFAQDII